MSTQAYLTAIKQHAEAEPRLLTLDAVPKRWNRLDIFEQGDRETVYLALILHYEERIIGYIESREIERQDIL
jgi:hypothetical protein